MVDRGAALAKAMSGRAANAGERTSGNRLPFDIAQGFQLPCAALSRSAHAANARSRGIVSARNASVKPGELSLPGQLSQQCRKRLTNCLCHSAFVRMSWRSRRSS